MNLLNKLKTKFLVDYPDPRKLADENDELGWDRMKHGLFAEQGTPDDEIKTERVN